MNNSLNTSKVVYFALYKKLFFSVINKKQVSTLKSSWFFSDVQKNRNKWHFVQLCRIFHPIKRDWFCSTRDLKSESADSAISFVTYPMLFCEFIFAQLCICLEKYMFFIFFPHLIFYWKILQLYSYKYRIFFKVR